MKLSIAITSRSECASHAQSAILLPVTFNERRCYTETRKTIILDSDTYEPLPMVNRNEWNYAAYPLGLGSQPRRGSNHYRSISLTRHACPHREWSAMDHLHEPSVAWLHSRSRPRDFWCSSRLNHCCRCTIRYQLFPPMELLHVYRRFEEETEHKDWITIDMRNSINGRVLTM